MAVTPLPSLDRTAATFKTDVDSFFAQKLPKFSVEVNQVATDAQISANAASASKTAAGTSETNAANSASAANTAKTNAATSATNAATSATNAANSATAAANSATAANASKTAAATSEGNAAASATKAEKAAASIGSGPVTSVNGKTGAPVLVKADLDLGLVDNLSIVARGMTGSPAVLGGIANIDEYLALTNGWYAVIDTTKGTKPPGQVWGTLLIVGRAFQNDCRIMQIFCSEDESRVFVRRCNGGTWFTWRELTRPVPGTAKKRLPLVAADDGLTDLWSTILSVPNYLDRSITGNAAAAQVLDVSTYSIFDLGLTDNTTFSFTGLPTLVGETLTIIIRIRQNGTPKTITWPSNVTWLTYGSAVPPTPGASQIIEYILSTTGAPANWYGRVGVST